MANQYYLTDADLAEIQRMKRKLDGVSGPGVDNRPDSLTIGGRNAARRTIGEESAATVVLVKITGSATGGGKYNGRILTARGTTADVATTGDLAESEIGTPAAADDALVLNTREVGKTTHDLSSSTYLPLIFIGQVVQTNSDGKRVVAIDGMQWEDCT
jgi:hypothetical protein